MKALLTATALCLAILGCGRSHSDLQLEGTWTMDDTDRHDIQARSTIVVGEAGHYVCNVSLLTTDGTNKAVIEGVFEPRGTFLIDTITKHSDTNATPPYSHRVEILDYDGSTLTLKWEETTNAVVLRRAED